MSNSNPVTKRLLLPGEWLLQCGVCVPVLCTQVHNALGFCYFSMDRVSV